MYSCEVVWDSICLAFLNSPFIEDCSDKPSKLYPSVQLQFSNVQFNLSHIYPAFSDVKYNLSPNSGSCSINNKIFGLVCYSTDKCSLHPDSHHYFYKLWRPINANFWLNTLTQTTGRSRLQCAKRSNDFSQPWTSLQPLQVRTTQTVWWKTLRRVRTKASSFFHPRLFDCLFDSIPNCTSLLHVVVHMHHTASGLQTNVLTWLMIKMPYSIFCLRRIGCR